jgi:site-specific DNA-adenine methylase
MSEALKAPFPWFGGKSKVAGLVWNRFGNVPNYVEPFFGSGAVLLGRPTTPGIETINDLDCVAPETKIWCSDLTWVPAGSIKSGDQLIGFDEFNGPSRIGLRASEQYRRWRIATVTNVRSIRKPSYRLTFDDGTTVVCSGDHQWLGGSHVSGGRGWRWQKTSSLRCDKGKQRSWVCKLTDVVQAEQTRDAGWIAGFLDGEGNVKTVPGWQVNITQKLGPEADKVVCLLQDRGFTTTRRNLTRPNPKHSEIAHISVIGGMRDTLHLLMQIRPDRLIRNLIKSLPERSLYGRDKQAVGLVAKEYLGETEVIAIETDCHTFIAEGLASHNCMVANFWRALQQAPDKVTHHADHPINEADLHARHNWLVNQDKFRERMKTDPDYYDAKIAGWWVWGQCAWIAGGWCQKADSAEEGKRQTRSMPSMSEKRGFRRSMPALTSSMGVHRKRPQLSSSAGIHRTSESFLLEYMYTLAERLRKVRVCCGDWSRICGYSPTDNLGLTGVFLDPPYSAEALRDKTIYSTDSLTVAHEVREWAITNGDNKDLRIALCGYEGEHKMPDSWECVAWKANGGFSNQGNGAAKKNAKRERIWFSPHCRHVTIF